MNDFMEIMQLMNNGLNNESTLNDTYPKIVALALAKNPNSIENVQAWMLEEACFSKPHPGLDNVKEACEEVISASLSQNLDQRIR